MPYLTSVSAMHSLIFEYTKCSTLWIDTEVADYNSSNPKLSLIQVLDDPNDMSGDRTYVLDVLESPDIVAEFIENVMVNPDIEKVFHNASYDVKFLGSKKAKNVTCTLEMAKQIPYYILPLPNYQLKTLASKLCNFQDIDKHEQTSDWRQRPLTYEQIEYAYLDCIYLAQVHRRLLEINQTVNPEPIQENLAELTTRYQEIEQNWKLIKSEFEHLQERIKKAMQAQDLPETVAFKLASYERRTVKVAFSDLVKLAESQGIELNFPITLTQKMQKDLGQYLEELSLEIEKNQAWRLIAKTEENSNDT